MVLTALWSGYAAIGTDDVRLGWLALGLAVPGVGAMIYGYRAMQRETDA